MGIEQWIRRIIDLFSPTEERPPDATRDRPRAPPPGLPPHQQALRAAQERRRSQGITRKSGKPARPWHVAGYESLERTVTLRLGRFPWSKEEARDVLAQQGFDARAVEAYLQSPAARRLLE